MLDPFYLGEISYQVARATEQPIPSHEVWLYQRPTRIYDVLWGNAARPTYLPRLDMRDPLFQRFRQRAATTWSLPFFETVSAKIYLNIAVEIILLDPIKYLQSQLYLNDDIRILETMLQETLDNPFVDRNTPSFNETFSTPKLQALIPAATRQLIPGTSLSEIAQGQTDFSIRGMEVRITLKEILFSPAWNTCVERATVHLSTELQEMKKRIQAAYKIFMAQPTRGDFRDYCAIMLKDYMQSMWEKTQSRLEDLINDVRGTTHTFPTGSVTAGPLAALKATLFNFLVQNITTQVIVGHGVLASQDTHSPSLLPTNTLAKQDLANQRQEQIQALYTIAINTGWQITPAAQAVHEQVIIHVGNDYDLTLIIPRSFPSAEVIVSAIRRRGSRLPFRDVNALVLPVLQYSGQNLVTLIKGIVSNLP